MTVQPIASFKSAESLAGRVAIVTGSTSGIGLGIASALAAAGADIVINGLGDPEAIERTRAELADEFGVAVRYHGRQPHRSSRCGASWSRTPFTLIGRIDILVNNAGIQHVSPIEDFPPEKWDAILALNLSAAFHTIRAAFRPMKQRGWGRIINVASAHGLVASPFKSAYVAAKHGIVGLTKTVALEGASHGVTCNAICPGYVWTPLVENQIGDTAEARGISREEVIETVLLVRPADQASSPPSRSSERSLYSSARTAAQSITGTALPVDGGWVAQ